MDADPGFYAFSIIIAIMILAFIAESDRLLYIVKPKSKKVNSNYWGVYEGTQAENVVGSVEVKPLARKQKVIGGSTTYAAGRGVKMNGS